MRPEHKFCVECGARLRRPATELVLAPPSVEDEAGDRLPALAAHGNHPMFDPVTGQLLAVPPPPPLPPPDDDATNVLPAIGEPMGRGSFGPPSASPHGPGHWDHPSDTGPLWPAERDDMRAAPTAVVQPPYRNDDGAGHGDGTARVPMAYTPWEVVPWEQPEVVARRAFGLKPLLLVAVLSAAAAAVGMFIRLLDVDLSAGDPDPQRIGGAYLLNDFGTNLTIAGILMALTMVLGAIAWCAGFRWGAGLAGGAGAALAGWSAIALAQAELVANVVDSRAAVTRDIGYWGVAVGGGLGVVVLALSLVRAGDDRRAGLDPWVAALGAMATIAAVIGPLIPMDDADVELNWSSPWPQTRLADLPIDLPTVWLAARLVQLGLLLLCGIFGFLLVRRYGLGLAIGGTIGAGWMVLTTATEQTDAPIGLAIANPGSADGKPHLVTILGVGLMVFFGLVATAMALIDDR